MNDHPGDSWLAQIAGWIHLLDKGDHWIHGRLANFLSDVPILNRLMLDTRISARGLLLAALGTVLLAIILPATELLLRRFDLQEKNFRGDRIPQSFGIAILIWLAIILPLDGFLLARELGDRLQWLACIVGFGLLGLLDDVRGDKTVKGFRGHFRALLSQAHVTTGLLKALGGLGLAVWLAMQLQEATLWQTSVSALVIALCANAMNLFDLRPGRASAVFCVVAVCLLAFVFHRDSEISAPSLLYVLIPAMVVWARDANARVMLGDAGSNLLGGALGLGICAYTGVVIQSAACIGLIVLTICAERFSISAVIDHNRLLRYLDALTGERNSKSDGT